MLYACREIGQYIRCQIGGEECGIQEHENTGQSAGHVDKGISYMLTIGALDSAVQPPSLSCGWPSCASASFSKASNSNTSVMVTAVQQHNITRQQQQQQQQSRQKEAELSAAYVGRLLYAWIEGACQGICRERACWRIEGNVCVLERGIAAEQC